MLIRTLFVSALAVGFLGLVACSTSTSGGGASSSSGGSSTISGTIGGAPFSTVSAVGNVGKGGGVDLIFSDAADLCAGLKVQKFAAGVTIVQVYNLSGTAPGKFTPVHDDVKYATLKDTCPSGASVNDHVAGSGDATTTSVTIDSLTDTRVAGSLQIEFADGSSVAGSFDIPMCEVSEAEDATCQ